MNRPTTIVFIALPAATAEQFPARFI